MIEMLNCDCMEFLKNTPDKAFDLSCVDPPYGIGEKFKGGKTGKMQFNEVVEKGWDEAPSKEYFQELKRVSKNQIIFGGNYFNLPPSRCWIIWDKLISEDFSLAMAEMAWTSFDEVVRIVRMATPKDGGKIHPTQKPIALYKWLLSRYAKPGDKILDTHGGSGSICIACHDLGYDLTWMELDADYYNAACERYQRHAAQGSLFEPEPQKTFKQGGLL